MELQQILWWCIMCSSCMSLPLAIKLNHLGFPEAALGGKSLTKECQWWAVMSHNVCMCVCVLQVVIVCWCYSSVPGHWVAVRDSAIQQHSQKHTAHATDLLIMVSVCVCVCEWVNVCVRVFLFILHCVDQMSPKV